MSIAEKLTTIAENQQRVFDAGRNSGGGGGDYDSGYNDGYNESYNSGYSDGHSMGFSEGEQAEYGRFWDAFQNYGNRVNYQYAFAGNGGVEAWTDEIFKPKYDMILGYGYTGTSMFFYSSLTNIAESLENQGARLDTSRCGYFSQMFQYSATKRIPEIVCTSDYGSGLDWTFGRSQVETIDKLVVMESLKYPNTFTDCANLKNITFDGVIGNNIDFSACVVLSKASIENIIEHLSGTASGKVLTLASAAVTSAFGSTTASAWTTLVNSKSNWTISLV